MPQEDVLITEHCGSLGDTVQYTTDSNVINRRKITQSTTTSLFQTITGFFREVLLPYGYPDSVSKDYLTYQKWDTLQAFCSTIIGIFTTQAILKGVGVGNAQASAFSATITWIIKDGTGMTGRIIFAWWKGNGLDGDCKKWRLFADFLNDAAMLLELSLPYYSSLSVEVLCASSVMKSLVGVAGGATRASITNHQAVKGNMAEISAKDGSQETLVNLIASFVGIFLLNYCTEPPFQWAATLILVCLHLFANFKAVSSLMFTSLNGARSVLVLRTYLSIDVVLGPERINKMESVILGFGENTQMFCGFSIVMGDSLKSALHLCHPDELKNLSVVYGSRKYLLIPDFEGRTIYVAFEKGEVARDVIGAYYNAVLLGIATCLYNNITLDVYSKRQLHHSTPLTRLRTFMKSYPNNGEAMNMPPYVLRPLNAFVDQEMEMFFMALQLNGWRMDYHSLALNEWRVEWKDAKKIA